MAHVGRVRDRRRRRLLRFLFCCYAKHHNKKQFGEEKVYFSLQVTAHHQWKRRQELEAGTWKQELNKAEVIEGRCLLACSQASVQLPFLYSADSLT